MASLRTSQIFLSLALLMVTAYGLSVAEQPNLRFAKVTVRNAEAINAVVQQNDAIFHGPLTLGTVELLLVLDENRLLGKNSLSYNDNDYFVFTCNSHDGRLKIMYSLGDPMFHGGEVDDIVAQCYHAISKGFIDSLKSFSLINSNLVDTLTSVVIHDKQVAGISKKRLLPKKTLYLLGAKPQVHSFQVDSGLSNVRVGKYKTIFVSSLEKEDDSVITIMKLDDPLYHHPLLAANIQTIEMKELPNAGKPIYGYRDSLEVKTVIPIMSTGDSTLQHFDTVFVPQGFPKANKLFRSDSNVVIKDGRDGPDHDDNPTQKALYLLLGIPIALLLLL